MFLLAAADAHAHADAFGTKCSSLSIFDGMLSPTGLSKSRADMRAHADRSRGWLQLAEHQLW